MKILWAPLGREETHPPMYACPAMNAAESDSDAPNLSKEMAITKKPNPVAETSNIMN